MHSKSAAEEIATRAWQAGCSVDELVGEDSELRFRPPCGDSDDTGVHVTQDLTAAVIAEAKTLLRSWGNDPTGHHD